MATQTELETCYIVGGGPSLTNFDWSQLDDKFVIAINRAYEQLPNADIVYFTDIDFYQHNKTGLLAHSGRLIKGSTRVPCSPRVDARVEEYKLVAEKGWKTNDGQLCHGSNSTYAAINLAGAHLGFKTIYLLGVDLKVSQHQSHWHDGHPRIDPPSVYDKMERNFNSLAPRLKRINIDVFNINKPEHTSLTCFPLSDHMIIKGPADAPVPKTQQTVSQERVLQRRMKNNVAVVQKQRERKRTVRVHNNRGKPTSFR